MTEDEASELLAVYNDAELTAVAILRDAVTENQQPPAGYSMSRAVTRHLEALREKHPDPSDGALVGVTIALARFAYVALAAPRRTGQTSPRSSTSSRCTRSSSTKLRRTARASA